MARPGDSEQGSPGPGGAPPPGPAGRPRRQDTACPAPDTSPSRPPAPWGPPPWSAPWRRAPVPAGPFDAEGALAPKDGDREDEEGPLLDRPDAPPSGKSAAGSWLLIGFAGFAIGQVAGTIFVAIAAAVAGESGEVARFATMAEPPEWYVGTSLVGLWVGFFGGPWIASKLRGTGHFLRDLGVRFRPIDLVGVLFGVGAQFVLDALYAPFISHLKNFTAPTQRLVGASHGWGYVAIAVLTVCGAPFFEEVLFRGLAFKALARLFVPTGSPRSRRRTAGLAGAVVVDGVLFGLAHWEVYQFAGLALFGMLLAVISYRTGRLGMSMVAHASFNLVAVLAVVGGAGVVH